MNSIVLKNGEKIELNQAFNMDCLDFMKELPDKCIDLVLTDPPYGLADWNDRGSNKSENRNYSKNKEWDILPTKEVFSEIFRISKNQIIWGWQYFTDKTPLCNGPIVWYKQTGMHFADGELAFCSVKNALRVCEISRESYTTTIHPTQKPLKLFNWCLTKFTKEKQIIFDPFLGSFTTAISANKNKLNWLGCEKDPDYFKSGYHRYEQETKQLLMDF